jgi:uncharacterized repeat protein (TIGR03803 family)
MQGGYDETCDLKALGLRGLLAVWGALAAASGAMAIDGALPRAGLIVDSAGNLFGTTEFGGATGEGVVFKLSQAEL